MPADPALIEKLRILAQEGSTRAYCPYSKFRVGAAIYSRGGQSYVGCNVENASYGLTNCAERTAIFQMVARGEVEFDVLVLYTPTPKPTAPCGSCRQVLLEFNPEAEVISFCDGPDTLRSTVRELLPHAFGPKSLT